MPEVIPKSLTPKQEKFCQLFATERDFFGNGTKSYLEAYPDCTPESARRCASELLTNLDILARVNEILEFNGLNDASVDKELAFVIAQSADFSSKVAAIREYNKLKQRITEKSEQLVVADVTSNGETVGTTDLDTIIAQVKKSTEVQA